MRLISPPLALLKVAIVALAIPLSSCSDDSEHSGTRVSREDANALFSHLDEARKFEQQATEMFVSEGVTFSLFHASGGIHEDGGTADIDEIRNGPSMMICRGIKSNDQILDFDKRFRKAFSNKDLAGIELYYEYRSEDGSVTLMSASGIQTLLEIQRKNVSEGQDTGSTPLIEEDPNKNPKPAPDDAVE